MSKYNPHELIDGDEMKIQNSSGELFAGEWEYRRMNESDQISVGYYDDPVSGPRTVASFPRNSLLGHACITGLTGYGKSSLITNIARQLTSEKSTGLCLVDPKGDATQKLIERLPENRIEDIVFVQPGENQKETIGVNILETRLEENDARYESEVKHITDALISFLNDSERHWGPRLDYLMKAIIEQLVRADEEYNIVDMKLLLESSRELEKFVSKHSGTIDDNLVEKFRSLDTNTMEGVVSRIEPLCELQAVDSIARKDAEIDISEVVHDGKVLVLDTSNIQSARAKQAVAQTIISRIWASIQSREAIPEQNRVPFYLCVDGADAVFTERFNMNDSISLGKNYNFGLIYAFQQFSQLPDSVESGCRQMNIQIPLNSGTSVSEAASVAQLHGIGKDRLVDLDPYTAVMKPITEDNFVSEIAFDVSLFAPIPPRHDVDSIIEQSLDNYG